ncbi:MAG: hypothetical protein ABSF48_29295, partial [Thermodesulfobacteriota bacterium]
MEPRFQQCDVCRPGLALLHGRAAPIPLRLLFVHECAAIARMLVEVKVALLVDERPADDLKGARWLEVPRL